MMQIDKPALSFGRQSGNKVTATFAFLKTAYETSEGLDEAVYMVVQITINLLFFVLTANPLYFAGK